jgi:hypothetical protein
MGKGLIITIVILGVILVGFFSLYGYTNNLRSQSLDWETQLNAKYLSNQNFLSGYISTFYEQVGIANLKSDKMDQIILDAVKGRYGNTGFSSNGALFSAITEAYPDVKGLNIMDRVMDTIAAGRDGYKNKQDDLVDTLRGFDKWRQDGWTQSFIIEHVIGIPSHRLQARIGDHVVYGQAALEKMQQIVLTSSAKQAYETGTMEPLAIPGATPPKKK